MRTHVLLISAAALWCCLILAAPILAAGGGMSGRAASAVYLFFSPVCHQWDSHSFHLLGEKLPVCIRCSAIYFGFFLGILAYPSLGRRIERMFSSRVILAAAVAGMIVDVACAMTGVSESSTLTRVVTGGTFGMLAAFVLTPLLEELIGTTLFP